MEPATNWRPTNDDDPGWHDPYLAEQSELPLFKRDFIWWSELVRANVPGYLLVAVIVLALLSLALLSLGLLALVGLAINELLLD